MDAKQALQILLDSVIAANRRGAFELAESKVIAEAVEVFTKKPEGVKKEEENGTDSGTEADKSEAQG